MKRRKRPREEGSAPDAPAPAASPHAATGGLPADASVTVPGKFEITVGRPEEWVHFGKAHERLLGHVPALAGLANDLLRTPGDLDALADKVIATLTRTCVEDFFEILCVCGNGYGIAGQKLLRTLYENAVTAAYLHLHPEEAAQFMDFWCVDSRKFINAIAGQTGESEIPPEVRAMVDSEFERVRDRFIVVLCSECGRTGLNFRWSSLDFVSMAKQCTQLSNFLVPAYRGTLRYTHASSGGVLGRLEWIDGQLGDRPSHQREEAADALMWAHIVLLAALDNFSDHFTIRDHANQFQICLEAWAAIWAPPPSA